MLAKIFSFLGWFKDYNLEKFKLDAVAGLTVALVLIPQSMPMRNWQDCQLIMAFMPLFCRP